MRAGQEEEGTVHPLLKVEKGEINLFAGMGSISQV